MSDSYLVETRNPGGRFSWRDMRAHVQHGVLRRPASRASLMAEVGLIRRGILARRPIVEDPRRLHLLDVAFGPTADAGYQTNERFPQVR